jgi:hypothetical protein
MSKRMYGSICLTDISNAYKAGHPGITKSETNGKIYVNLTVWLNDQKDKFENDAGVQISQPKEYAEKPTYIGNLKHAEAAKAAPAEKPIAEEVEDDDLGLPF